MTSYKNNLLTNSFPLSDCNISGALWLIINSKKECAVSSAVIFFQFLAQPNLLKWSLIVNKYLKPSYLRYSLMSTKSIQYLWRG